MNMDKLIQQARTKAAKLSSCPEWRNFKSKWDGKLPKKNTKQFAEYTKDHNVMTDALKAIGLNVVT